MACTRSRGGMRSTSETMQMVLSRSQGQRRRDRAWVGQGQDFDEKSRSDRHEGERQCRETKKAGKRQCERRGRLKLEASTRF